MDSLAGKDRFKNTHSASNKDAGRIRERFALLLNGFSLVAAQGRTSVAPVTARIQTLLKQ